ITGSRSVVRCSAALLVGANGGGGGGFGARSGSTGDTGGGGLTAGQPGARRVLAAHRVSPGNRVRGDSTADNVSAVPIPDDVARYVARRFPASQHEEARALLAGATLHDGSNPGIRLLRCAAVASGGSLERLR